LVRHGAQAFEMIDREPPEKGQCDISAFVSLRAAEEGFRLTLDLNLMRSRYEKN